MKDLFGKPKRAKKERFGAKAKRRGARLFGAPPKRKAKDRNFGRAAKRSALNKAFGKAEKFGKDTSWGKEPKASEKAEERSTKAFGRGGLGFFKRFVRRQRRAAELGRHWALRDEISEGVQRQAHVIETRLNNTGNEIGSLVSQVAGKPLTGDQKARIANYIDDKKREVTERVGLVEQAIQLVGSLFGRGKPGG